MDEEIDRMTEKLSLSDVEARKYMVPDGIWGDNRRDYERCIVGRFLPLRRYNFAAVQDIFMNAFNPAQGMKVEKLENWRFLFVFNHKVNRDRVLTSGPWNFRNDIKLLKTLTDTEDPNTTDLDWTDCTRVADCDTCDLRYAEDFVDPGPDTPYGPDLRAPPPRRFPPPTVRPVVSGGSNWWSSIPGERSKGISVRSKWGLHPALRIPLPRTEETGETDSSMSRNPVVENLGVVVISEWQGNSQDWMRGVHNRVDRDEFCFFLIVAWFIWHYRNKSLMEYAQLDPETLIIAARLTPPRGRLKVNFDGATFLNLSEIGTGLDEEGDEEPSLFRKNSKFPRLEVSPVSATLPSATETASREDHALAVALLTSDPGQSTLAENVSAPELPTTVTSSSCESIPGTDMGIPFTPSPSPPLAESSPIVTVDPNQASISSPIVTPDPTPPSSIAPITVTSPEATLKEESPDNVQQEDGAPPLIKRVLEENQDVMPPQLPAKLPPRREVDHVIQLEPAPLTDLLKKNKPWVWSEACQLAFEDLKAAVSEEPVLALPNFEKMFELHTDASDFAIGGVLMQEGHPIAFESRKLNETERRYTVQEKEMTAIVHCLRIWRHYLLGSRFVVKTDNVATSYFQTQKKLSPKQARWQDFLAEFDYVLEYKPGKANVVADALSRKAELAAISLAKGNVHEKIKEGLEHDPMAQELMRLAKEGKTRQFWVEDGLLYTKGRRDCTAEEAARAFFKNVVKYWGLPKSIISDRDPRFTGRLWTELFKLLGSELCFSTSFHPQTDGQTERVNALLECYLRHFVSANQHDWAKILDVAQFSYNLQRSEATGKSPFELATGQQPLTPHTLAISFDSARCPGAAKMAKSWAEQSDLAKSFLEKARRKMKKWADPKRRHLEFNTGDKVLIKLIPQQFKAFRGMHKGLVRKYEGPYPVVAKVGKVSYLLDLPSTLKIHPVFHVSMLRPYQEDEEDPSRGESHRAPPVVTKSFDKEIEEVLSHKVVRRRGVKPTTHYFIKWKGLPESEATWESQDDLWQDTWKTECITLPVGNSKQ
ncbi:hypothetical protein BUALT_Bualt06G0067200 [Buddleja alternifolia]|uniref:Uncharacterized protein n=1 Tax=Buddleja alternifolia TaxID=168488 RepID=A0AAV6XDA0_9LAMI|nr:hypothetical protein BUALT_Bualt06G0067200 [Buddleja alternifolia]